MNTTTIQVRDLNCSVNFYKSILALKLAAGQQEGSDLRAMLRDDLSGHQVELQQSNQRIVRRRLPFCLPLTTQRAQVVLANPSLYLASLTAFAPRHCCHLPVGVADPDGHLVAICLDKKIGPESSQKISGFWSRFVRSFSQLADFHGYYR